ncbi:MAG: hypothetical protein R2709_10285 [Marmoricola sp.]
MSLYDGDTLVGESITDAQRRLPVCQCAAAQRYQMAFGIKALRERRTQCPWAGHRQDLVIWLPTRAAMLTESLLCPSSTQRTWPVTVSAGAQTQHLNAGVVLAMLACRW